MRQCGGSASSRGPPARPPTAMPFPVTRAASRSSGLSRRRSARWAGACWDSTNGPMLPARPDRSHRRTRSPMAPGVIRQQIRDRSPSVEVRHLPGIQAGCQSLTARRSRNEGVAWPKPAHFSGHRTAAPRGAHQITRSPNHRSLRRPRYRNNCHLDFRMASCSCLSRQNSFSAKSCNSRRGKLTIGSFIL